MAGGEPEKSILFGVNFGRDADTIGTMIGGLCGAFRGIASLPEPWVRKVEANPAVAYRTQTSELAKIVRQRGRIAADYAHSIAALIETSAESGTNVMD